MAEHTSHKKVWAIINVTPDSFWQGSRVEGESDIIEACRLALADGAQVLDIGGMSTRPGYVEISAEQELARLDNALRVIKAEFPTTPLSIDTYRSAIVRRIYDKYGAFIVNDVQAGVMDGDMYATVAELGLDYVMMSHDADVAAMELFFERQIAAAREAGVAGEIIIDPGFGFGKTIEGNFAVLRDMGSLQRLGRLLVGVSRKSMIFKVLECTPAEALPGTCAIHWQALLSGADILRVHDVRPASDLIKLFEFFAH